MHTEVKQAAASAWLRLGGTFIGAILSAVSAIALFLVAAALDILNGAGTFEAFVAALSFAGACFGFILPRQTFHSLWFFFPDILDPRTPSRS
jgi:hypothetical protein